MSVPQRSSTSAKMANNLYIHYYLLYYIEKGTKVNFSAVDNTSFRINDGMFKVAITTVGIDISKSSVHTTPLDSKAVKEAVIELSWDPAVGAVALMVKSVDKSQTYLIVHSTGEMLYPEPPIEQLKAAPIPSIWDAFEERI
jgi:hypothetical protein